MSLGVRRIRPDEGLRGASPPTARPVSQQAQPMDRCSTRCAHAIVDSARTIGGGGMTLRRRATVYPGGPSTPALPSFARPGPRMRPGLASSTGCGRPCASYRDVLEIDLVG